MDNKELLASQFKRIDDSEPVIEETSAKKEKKAKKEKTPKEKKVKETKVKEPKQPKEKKVKEPKPPKEKKVKEPKPPKEKKIKEPKPSKEKKVKELKVPEAPKEKKSLFNKKKEVKIENTNEILAVEAPKNVEEISEPEVVRTVTNEGRVEEEIVLPAISSVKKVKSSKKRVKKEKKPKEKKVKEPKQPKEKKVKEPKPPKEKKVKEPKPPKEKKPHEPMKGKDYATIGILIVALALVSVFVYFRFFPQSDTPIDNTESTTVSNQTLSDIQISRDGVIVNLVQSDIPDIFYGFTKDYKIQYYHYRENTMVQVKATGNVKARVELGNQTIPVTIDYIEYNGKKFGMGNFLADQSEDVFFYKMVAFKLTDLPKGYEEENKALLLATTSDNVLTQGDIVWAESFKVDLTNGSTSRFLKIVNRTIDINTGAGVTDFCMLTKSGYSSTSGKIPFLSSREYPAGTGKQDIFIKDGNEEDLYVSDVYGRFVLTDGDDIVFLRKTNAGFDAIRKSGDKETVTKSFYGKMTTTYIQSGEYILNKNDGTLYNLITGEEKTLVGFRMTPKMMSVSPDGKYIVMLGMVNSVMDWQVHIFNLETGEYMKYEEKNYSEHSNLTFIDNTTAVYMVVDPNQVYEYVVFDVTKAVN